MIMIPLAAIMSDCPSIVASLKVDETDLPTSEYEITIEVRARISIPNLLSISTHDSVSVISRLPAAHMLILRSDIPRISSYC